MLLFNILSLNANMLSAASKRQTMEIALQSWRELQRDHQTQSSLHPPGNQGPERLGNLPRFTQLMSNRAEIRSGMGFLMFLSPNEMVFMAHLLFSR